MDGFLFEDSKYINSLMAYDWWMTQKRPMIKTWLEPGNKLLYIYDKVVNNGLLTLPDSAIHTLEIMAYDDVSNTSLVTFSVQKRSRQDETAMRSDECASRDKAAVRQDKIDKEIKALSSREAHLSFSSFEERPMFPDSVNVFHEHGMRVTVPAGALYRPIWFTSDTLPRPDSSCSAYWRIHTTEVPLHHAAQVYLPAAVPTHLQSKAIVVKYNSKGKISSSGGTWTDNGVSASIYSFGDYFVALDTVPPLIEPQFARQANVKKHEKLSIKITDDMSGISSYSAMVDGEWALMEYDAKEDMLEYFFNPAYIKRNQMHTLVVTVMDKRLNMSTLETQFIW
jgi:hypothetical protein